MNKIFLLACIVLFIANPTQAQKIKTGSVIQYTSTQLDSIAALIPGSEKPSRVLATSTDNELYVLVVRTKEGAAEMHEQFDDVAIIRSGSGILKTGPELKGATETTANGSRELLGGTITDSKTRKVSAGDFIVVPARLAHQFIPTPGDPLVYYVVKVRHPLK